MKTNPNDFVKLLTRNDYDSGVELIGLTKREYFASMAMKGILDAGFDDDYIVRNRFDFAKASVLMADALIAELNKGEL